MKSPTKDNQTAPTCDPVITARFHPQSWVNDYAVDVDAQGVTTFDVTDNILEQGKEAAMKIRDNRYESDELRYADNAPQWIKNWSGPFWIEVEESISNFFQPDS